MKTRLSGGCIFFSVSGTGAQVKETQILPQAAAGIINALGTNRYGGRVRRIVIREAVGGGATAANFYLIHRNRVTVTAPASEPAENIIVVASAVVLTASASAASLDSPISAEPAFQDSLLLVAEVTAAVGAWTILGFVEVEV